MDVSDPSDIHTVDHAISPKEVTLKSEGSFTDASGADNTSLHPPRIRYESDSDEGFDEDWAEEYPLFSRPSGVQFIPIKSPGRELGGDMPSSLSSSLVVLGANTTPQNEPNSADSSPINDITSSSSQHQTSPVTSTTAPVPLSPSIPPWVAAFTRPYTDGKSVTIAPPPTSIPVNTNPIQPSTRIQSASLPALDVHKNSNVSMAWSPRRSSPSLDSLGQTVRRVARETDFTHLEPGSQRNKDSVLHYFVATQESEEVLDQYLTGIIQAFLDNPSAINANTAEDPSSIRARFSQFKVPHSGEYGTSLEEYLFALKANVIDKATRVASPRMIGHMTTALPYFHRPLARLLTALNQNVVKLETALTMTYLERETIAMLHREFFKLSNPFYDHYMHSFDRSLGVFTSGGTVANITAMWIARNKALKADHAKETELSGSDKKKSKKAFRGVDKEGFFNAMMRFGYKGAVIIGSVLMHYSFKKAADLLGIGDDGLSLIPTDKEFRLRTDILEQKVKEFKSKNYLIIAIVAVAGTTETGSIDNLMRIATIAKENNIHFHVDAAWGGPVIFSREHRSKLHGISYADTITIDGHKQLYTPMGLGLVLFRNPSDASHIRKSANYVIRHDSPDLGKFTLEGSRPANSLHLHASLHLLGRDGIESLVTRSATLVRQMASRLRTHPLGCFQTLHETSTNILLYRYIPKRLRAKVAAMAPLETSEDEEISDCTRRVQSRQAKEGEAGFVSRTSVYLPDPSFGDILTRPATYAPSRPSSNASSPERSTAPRPSRSMELALGSVSERREEDADSVSMSSSSEEEEADDPMTRFAAVMPNSKRVDAFRVVIANPLTKWEDVEAVIAEQVQIGEKIEAEMAMERPNAMAEKVNMWIGWPFDM
ncbi:hypothetical protein HDU97_009831 [Phlyctochytrium planicorne]|nr:hypothetical protein HDU97_009831 [Phlyctochytrium planicorne]